MAKMTKFAKCFILLLLTRLTRPVEYCKPGDRLVVVQQFRLLISGLPALKHNASELTVDTSMDCGLRCSGWKYCFGFNFKKRAKKRERNCQLTISVERKFDENGSGDHSDWDFYIAVGPRKSSCNEENPINPCQNGGEVIFHSSRLGYRCRCNFPYTGDHCEIREGYLHSTCSMLKADNPETPTGYYMIQPNKDQAPFTVLCDMVDKNGTGVTVFSHDSEEKTFVNGYEGMGEYRKNITYNVTTMEQIINVINSSRYCQQFIKWDCIHAGFYHQMATGPDSWWVSRQGYKMVYWGGATPGSKKCACGMTNSCFSTAYTCNCDSVVDRWLEDSGFLVDKEYLPVSELRFGDTGHHTEQGYHTLGKLLCWD